VAKTVARNKRLNVRRDREIAAIVAENVDRLRTMRDLSLRDLSKLTGDSVATLARVASVDSRDPYPTRMGVIVRLAEALGVTVNALLIRPK
jgi:transcriptional regulator with XRE-family HTH domain